MSVELGQKLLELLHDLLPNADKIGFLINPDSPNTVFDMPDMQAAARGLRLQLITVNARNEGEIEVAFSDLVQQHAAALVVQREPLLLSQRHQLVELEARYALPALHFERAFPAVGGLMSYGPDFKEANRLAGVYAGRVLKGEQPGNLPVVRPTKFELVINVKTARAMGLTIPRHCSPAPTR